MEIYYPEVPVKAITLETVLKSLKNFPFEDEDVELIEKLVNEAAEIARPKAAYIKSDIEELGDDYIITSDTRFTSALLRKNVSKCSFVLAYTASCGRELYEWSLPYASDLLAMYVTDIIMELYLRKAIQALHSEVKEKFYADCDVSSMAPGSLDDEWPITEQKPLFSLLGDAAKKVGVELTDSCLMVPAKSISGIYFSADSHFENCMLCTRENCPNRRAKFKGSV